jgi:hypothetical protein
MVKTKVALEHAESHGGAIRSTIYRNTLTYTC